MKTFLRKGLILIFASLLATTVFATQTANAASQKQATTHSKTTKTKHKKKSNCRYKYTTKCYKNKKGKKVCKKVKICKTHHKNKTNLKKHRAK